jgi:hypothetical protein
MAHSNRVRRIKSVLLITIFLSLCLPYFSASPAQASATSCNLPPIARNDRAILFGQRIGVIIPVTHNDTDPSGCAIRVVAYSASQRGQVRFQNDHEIYYQYNGPIMPLTDSFTYTIANSSGKTATATVNVLLYQPMRPPVVTDDVMFTYPGRFERIDVVSNDSDPDAADTGMGLKLVDLHFNGDNTMAYIFHYSPRIIALRAYEVGTTTITYTVYSDATGLSATGKLTINVRETVPPIANDDNVTVKANSYVVIRVLDNDVAPVHVDPYTGLRVVGLDTERTPLPLIGKVNFYRGSNLLIYTPRYGQTGTYTFYYIVQDGYIGATASGKVTVTVVP